LYITRLVYENAVAAFCDHYFVGEIGGGTGDGERMAGVQRLSEKEFAEKAWVVFEVEAELSGSSLVGFGRLVAVGVGQEKDCNWAVFVGEVFGLELEVVLFGEFKHVGHEADADFGVFECLG